MMDGSISMGRKRWLGTASIAVVIFALAVWLRIVALGRDSFWLDEIYSASFADLSLVGTTLAILLLDVHPPLYYLQLNIWGRIGHGDIWLLLNSVFWSAGTLLAVFFGTTRQFGSRSGLLALSFCAVMGSEIYFADELRMYAMYGCLSVLCWIAANRFCADYRFRTALPLIALLAVVGAIHSASIIAASALLLYVFPAGNMLQVRRLLRTWIGTAAVVACAYLPWAVNASIRHVEHTSRPSIQAASHTVGGWILGYGDAALPPWAGTSATIFIAVALIAAAVLAPRLRRLIFCFIAWPLVFGALLCLAVQPIWLDRTFAFCAPFVAIAFGVAIGDLLKQSGRALSRPARSVGIGLTAAVLVGLGWLGYLQMTTPYKPDHYRELARYLAEHVQSGEIIYAPDNATFWGVSRYLVGPDWGSIFIVHDSAELVQLKKWQRLYALLGPDRFRHLGLIPEGRRLNAFRIPVFVGTSPLPDLQIATGVWLISFEGEQPVDLGACADRYPVPSRFGRLFAYHVRCVHSG
jgi:mannosyltransferase